MGNTDEKPKIKDVAVLSAHQVDFHYFVNAIRKENERYHLISKLEDTLGRSFNRIEYAHSWRQIPNFIDVEEACIYRLRE